MAGKLLIFAAVLLVAAEPAWRSKPISQWSAEDARQVLSASPWAARCPVAVLPERSEAALREGGRMGGASHTHIGYAEQPSAPGKLLVRWESAAPVRAAELKAGETGAPDWEGEYYAIAVYDIPGISSSSAKMLRGELKQTTALKCGAKKEVKPARIEIDQLQGGLVRILYLFPRTPAITAADGPIEFTTAIGRLYVAQSFETAEMQYQGKLAL